MKKNAQKILLIYPRANYFKDDIKRCVQPLGLAYLAAVLLKEGYDVKILDCLVEGYENVFGDGEFLQAGLSDDDIKDEIHDFNPDVVGVSCVLSTQCENAIGTLALAKAVNKNIVTLIGGSHPAYSIPQTLNHGEVDFVFLGESERSIVALLSKLRDGKDLTEVGGVAFRDSKGNIAINRSIEYIKDLDTLPFPARNLLNMERYFEINMHHSPYAIGHRVANILTSRGCPARCIFCTSTNFWGNRYRARSAENVILEIRSLKDEFGVDELQFTDDNITLNKKRLTEILDGIKDLRLAWCTPNGTAVWSLDEELIEKMRESGCYQLTFAIESGNQEVLDKIIKKPLRLKKVKPLVRRAQELGIHVHAFFICGFPGETLSQMHDTYNFAVDVDFDSASFFVATPLVGSEMLDICVQNDYLRGEFKPQELLYKIGHINTPDFTAGKVSELVGQFIREYKRRDKRK